VKRFLFIKSVDDMTDIQSELDALFTSLVHVILINHDAHSILYIYEGEYELNFEEVILNMLSDTLYDLTLYQSYQFEHIDNLMLHFEFIKENIELVPKKNGPYINNQKILKAIIHLPKQLLRDNFMRKYSKDNMMLDTLKSYFENDQNMSKAAKELYIHRNTLIQRLDKFMQETGFDVRKFQDAVLIYQLIP
jgi:sugar diacid utilization regulator